jgi:hypothetical protein
MGKLHWLIFTSFMFCMLFGCGTQSSYTNTAPDVEKQPSPEATSTPEQQKASAGDISEKTPSEEETTTLMEKIAVKEDKLSYKGYDLIRLNKKAHYVNKEANINRTIDVSYAVLKKKGKTVAVIDKIQASVGNDTKFGTFPLLKDKEKQLIIEQTSNRWWEYWIADVSLNFRLIYDSTKYRVGHDLAALDINKDGTYELIQSLHTFWFFDRLCGSCSPNIGIVFKYDERVGKYLPANQLFPQYALEGIEENIRAVQSFNSRTDFTKFTDTGEYLGNVLNVVIPYLYAAKVKEAWSFYDAEYRLADKVEMQAKLKAQLNRCAVYQAIHQR